MRDNLNPGLADRHQSELLRHQLHVVKSGKQGWFFAEVQVGDSGTTVDRILPERVSDSVASLLPSLMKTISTSYGFSSSNSRTVYRKIGIVASSLKTRTTNEIFIRILKTMNFE